MYVGVRAYSEDNLLYENKNSNDVSKKETHNRAGITAQNAVKFY